MRLDLTINCGINIVGDRNVVGNVALKPKTSERAIAGPAALPQRSAAGGAKRKAEEVGHDDAAQDGRKRPCS